ncbi:cysteine proteinase [Phlegmacium glaucopus]|nr:cysteine proteinase [Phlegmacium glaucopus]
MDQYDQEDFELWDSKETFPTSPHQLWRFGAEQLHICQEDGIIVLDLGAIVHMELALFNTFYSFWATVPVLMEEKFLNDEVQATIRYHRRLHAAITGTLLKSKSRPLSATLPLLQPWLKRTLCLFQHDVESRKRFAQVNCPSHLLESTISDIISRPRFQSYLKNVATPLIGAEDFRWTKCTPPWCLQTLVKWTSFREGTCGKQESNGIFILPHEALEETWDIYIDMPKFHRSFGNCNVLHQSIGRLKPNCWLDDEVVNAYIALLLVGGVPSVRLVGKKSDETVGKIMAKFQKILIPVNWHKDHWLAAILSVGEKAVFLLDSLKSYTGQQGRQNIFNTQILKEKIPLPDDWRLQEVQGIPQQGNSFDCGIYCCQFLKYTYFGSPIPNWEAEDADQLRRMMAMEIYEGSLRWFKE